MKIIKLSSIEEIIKMLNDHNIIYSEDQTTKYWLYKGFLMSAKIDQEDTTTKINDTIDVGQNFFCVEVTK